MPCFAPQVSGFFNLPGLGPVTRQQLGLVFGNLSELALKCEREARVEARVVVCRRASASGLRTTVCKSA